MRLRLRSFVLLLLFTTFSVAAMAQSAVKGTVKDETGNPMIGVAVSVPGTSIGTSTDAAGNYQIKAAADQKLQFNFLGFKPQLVDIDNRSVIDIVMTEDNTSLEEVVVVGYGVQKRRDIIGAVETLSADKLDGRLGQYQNAARSLQGAIPGMTVSFSDGKPNRGATMRIRGNVTSIGMGGEALVLVDGVEQALETVNPEDIESFTVLKDASSTAVYGVRGTFGVVLVTTKNPDKGSAKISYNGSFSLYQRTTTPQMVTNGYDWTTSFLESYINRGGSDPANINNVFKFSRQWYDELARRNADPSFEKWRINPGSGRYEYFGNTNWYDLFYRDVALGHTHSVTVQGGGDKATYYVNGRYFYQDGMYKEGNEYYDQYNVTARGTVKVRPWLRLDNTTTFYYRHSNQPQGHTGINNTMTPVRMIAHQGYPMTMPYNPDGSWTQTAVYTGYAGFVEGNNWRRDHKFDFRNKTSLTIDLIKDVLTAKGTLGYYYNHTLREILIYPSIYSNGPGMTGQQVADSKFEERTYDRDNIMGDATLTWTPRLGEDHNFSAMAGWSIDNIVYNSRAMERYGISDPDKPNPSMSTNSETMMYKDNGSYDWGMVGAFFRLSYGYKSRYLFEFSGRYDGCSKLMSNERWAFAPSGSFGWRISEEPFMEGARGWLDNLKIRLSANGLLNKYYEFEQVMDIRTSTVLSNGAFMTYTKAPALIPSGLTWEMATKYDIGIDFEALNGRLNIVADAYRTYTNDMYVTGPASGRVRTERAQGQLRRHGDQRLRDLGFMARLVHGGQQALLLQHQGHVLGQHLEAQPLHIQDRHPTHQLHQQLLRGHDAGRDMGLYGRRSVRDRRRSSHARLLEVRQRQPGVPRRRPASGRSQRRRRDQQRRQHDLRPRRSARDRQHHAALLLLDPGRLQLERTRIQHAVAGRRTARLVPRQGVELLLGPVRPSLLYGTAVARGALHRRQPRHGRILASSDWLSGIGFGRSVRNAQHPLPAKGTLHTS